MNQFARPGLGVTELPPVNADDNGKVLGVSDGAWAKVAASGGSDLPDDPAQDGTYNLQNTVSSGTGTLSWASGGSSGGGVLVVHDVDGTLDKTWQEIYDAIESGSIPIVTGTPTSSQAYITILGQLSGGMPPTMKYNVYNIGANFMADDPLYVADTSSDYPVKYTG